MREKKRYVAFEILSDNPISQHQAIGALARSFYSFLGTSGAGRAGYMFIDEKFNPRKQRGIIRINNRYVDALKATFCLTDTIENQQVIVRSLGVSGILRKVSPHVS